MRTYKPLSNVSYNSRQFLKVTLDSLIEQEKIDFYAFVPHKGEHGKKDHFHVFIQPTETIDTQTKEWQIAFEEPCQGQKPLNVEKWTKSKFADWYLYSKHDSAYLNAKRLKKEFYDYDQDLFETSSKEDFLGMVGEIDTFDLLSPIERLMNCRDEGLTWQQAMSKCRIPFGSMTSFMNVWKELDQAQQAVENAWIIKYSYDSKAGVATKFYVNKETGETRPA